MEAIIEYFSNMPKLHRSIILFGGLALFLFIENGVPFFKKKYNKTSHTALNVFFTITTVLINLGMAGVLFFATEFVSNNNFGILEWLGLIDYDSSGKLLLAMFLGVLLMDFIGAWLPHYIEHKVVFLWQFHVIHHSDKHVDASTANRHHPGESVLRFLFTTIAILVVGAPVWIVMIYQSLSVILSQFNHSNLNVPDGVDKAIRLVFCTPQMHRIHHHYRQPYSDTNYGNIFSFWDRIFQTYVWVDNRKLVFGVDTYMEKKETDDAWFLLKLPFLGYRKTPDYHQEDNLEEEKA